MVDRVYINLRGLPEGTKGYFRNDALRKIEDFMKANPEYSFIRKMPGETTQHREDDDDSHSKYARGGPVMNPKSYLKR